MAKGATDYLNAHCDALAMAISRWHGCKIHTVHLRHVLKAGGVRVDPDFVHCYAVVDGRPVDAKGYRDKDAILEDFVGFAAALRSDADQDVEFEIREHMDWEDLIDGVGVDPSKKRIGHAERFARRIGVI